MEQFQYVMSSLAELWKAE